MKRKIWNILLIFVLFLIVITFTPLVTPAGHYKPMWLGVPYTLMMGFIITALIVVCTLIATLVHPSGDKGKISKND